ncbi:MAG: DUF116 domain-containing protein [Clostridia bacterium]|nr:DUF116 domain-containing protein [Clostridia bacterium]
MKTKKRLFIALLVLSLLLLGGLVFSGWFLLSHRDLWVNQLLLMALAAVIVGFLGVIAFGIFCLVLTLWSSKAMPILYNIMILATNMLFPIALSLGQAVGFDKEKIRASFVAVNNQLVHNRGLKVDPKDILILAPHCLQWSQCPHKITVDVNNCRRCGRCPISDLYRLAETYGVRFAVATGGTMARSFVKKYLPRAIVAVACERDLTSGIQDVNPLPVMGVLNTRPNGPCHNTDVDVVEVEMSIREILNGKSPVGLIAGKKDFAHTP